MAAPISGAQPVSPLVPNIVRITLTLDIPITEILSPDPRLFADELVLPEIQAHIERERLQALPATDEELMDRWTRFSRPGMPSTVAT